jgi:hypothetical protein
MAAPLASRAVTLSLALAALCLAAAQDAAGDAPRLPIFNLGPVRLPFAAPGGGAPVDIEQLVDPMLNAFVENQKKGFPFPDGAECEEDAHRLCGGILRECAGDFGCSVQCLTDKAPHLSEGCRRAHPCFEDIDRFCAHVEGGQNKMMACLHGHAAELSAECLAQHPCLKEDHPAKCGVQDYAAPPVDFIGDIKAFLGNLHAGRLFDPLKNLARFAQHRRRPPPPPPLPLRLALPPRVFSVADGDAPGPVAEGDAGRFGGRRGIRSGDPVERLAAARERRELQRERRELLDERRELAAERRELLRMRSQMRDAIGDRPLGPLPPSLSGFALSPAAPAARAPPLLAALAALAALLLALL